MLKLSFHQTKAEMIVRVAATLIFSKLLDMGYPELAIGEVSENPQYGYTAKSSISPVGPQYVRITDLHDSYINWETVPFCECSDPEQYLLRSGDILFARTGATTGKTHLVKTTPNAVFASYLIRVRAESDVVLPEYLYSFFQSNQYWSQVIEEKQGSAQPNVNGKKLMGIRLPVISDKQSQLAIYNLLQIVRLRQDGADIELPVLPNPLTDIPHIIAHIDAISEQIAAARGLRQGVLEETNRLLRAILFFQSDWQPELIPMSELATLRASDVKVEPDDTYRFAGVYSFGRGVFVGSVKKGSEFKYTHLTRLHADNFVYPKLMAWEGAFGVVPAECDGLVVSPEFPVFEIDFSRVLPEVLDIYFKIPDIWKTISASSTGTNVRRRRLNPKAFLAYKFPLPPMNVQLELRDMKKRLESLTTLHNKVLAELDTLLPSLLDQAFRGEL